MEREDFFEGLSGNKKGTTSTLNQLVDLGHVTKEQIFDFKTRKGLTEKQVIKNILALLLEN